MQRIYSVSLTKNFFSETVILPQYDENYQLVFKFINNEYKSSFDGKSAYFEGTRNDGLSFRYSTVVSGNTATFVIDRALTAINGEHRGQIVLYDDAGLRFGSSNVKILVEKAARPDNAVDADVEEARSLAEQIASLAEQTEQAAEGVMDMSISAQTLAQGADATVTKTEQDGVVHLAFGIPTGPQGATPNLTIGTVTTLEPDASATASIAGTAEDPVLNLGIPRGQTGTVDTLPADFITALQTILTEAIYGSDQSANISALSDYSDGRHYYSVTKSLTHCTSSNASTKALGGEYYTTTITASEGYTLTSVTCTMGGVSQTVTNGVISIAEVTGDIVITATAEIHEEGLLYKLSETTTFDGSNTIDTGVAIEGNYNSDNTLEFTIVCTTTCTDTGDKYPFSVYSTAQSGVGLYVDLSGKSNVYGKWFTQSKNTSLSWVSADVLRIVFRKKSGEYPTVSFTKNGDATNTKTLTFTSTSNNAVIASADHVIIGCSPSGAGKLKGTMSDFRVYDRAYSDAELTSYLGGE